MNENTGPDPNPEGTAAGPSVNQVDEANLITLGLGPALAVANAYLAQSHAQQILFTNSVQQQQNGAIEGLAVTVKSAHQILSIGQEYDED